MTEVEFKHRFVQQMEKAEEPLPLPKESDFYHQLYLAKLKKEGTFMEWIIETQEHAQGSIASDFAFQGMMGFLLDSFYERGTSGEGVRQEGIEMHCECTFILSHISPPSSLTNFRLWI